MPKGTFIKVLLGFIGILVLGLGIGYFVGSENILNKNNITDNSENENSSKEEYTYTNEELDALGQYLWRNKTPRSLMVLNGKEENIDHLSMENLITLTISFMDYDEYQTYYANYYYEKYNEYASDDYMNKAILKTDVIENNYNELFGFAKKIEFKKGMEFADSFDHDGTYYENCDFENNMYICDILEGGGDSDGGYNYVYGDTKKENDAIVLTIYGYSYTPKYDADYDFDEYNISSSKTSNIGVISVNDFEIFLHKFEKEHLNEMDIYKITYQKDTNGNYYWYQTDN